MFFLLLFNAWLFLAWIWPNSNCNIIFYLILLCSKLFLKSLNIFILMIEVKASLKCICTLTRAEIYGISLTKKENNCFMIRCRFYAAFYDYSNFVLILNIIYLRYSCVLSFSCINFLSFYFVVNWTWMDVVYSVPFSTKVGVVYNSLQDFF